MADRRGRYASHRPGVASRPAGRLRPFLSTATERRSSTKWATTRILIERASMKCGGVKETYPGERRVALVPAVQPALGKAGISLLVEAGAGVAAGFSDEAYRDLGATVLSRREDVFDAADLLVHVRALGANCEAGITDLGLVR